MSQCGKDKKMVNKEQPNVSMMFLSHFDFLLWSTTKKTYDNMENIRFIKEQKVANVYIICASVHQYIMSRSQSKKVYNSAHHHIENIHFFWLKQRLLRVERLEQ